MQKDDQVYLDLWCVEMLDILVFSIEYRFRDLKDSEVTKEIKANVGNANSYISRFLIIS